MKINLKEFSNIKLENNQLILFKNTCTMEEFESELKKYNNWFGDYYGSKIAAKSTRNLPRELSDCFRSVQDSNFSVDIFKGLPQEEVGRFDLTRITLEIEE